MVMTTMVIMMHMKYMGAGGTDNHVFTVLCFDLPNQISSGQVAPKNLSFFIGPFHYFHSVDDELDNSVAQDCPTAAARSRCQFPGENK